MGKDTKYDSVNSTLNAIGKAVFVNFYYDFKNPLMSEEKIAEKLFTDNPNTTSHQQGFRVPRARHLFKEKKRPKKLKNAGFSVFFSCFMRFLPKNGEFPPPCRRRCPGRSRPVRRPGHGAGHSGP